VENLLGKENEGFGIIMSSQRSRTSIFADRVAGQILNASGFNHERLWLACTSLRLARICAEDDYQHAINRETFGKKLFENQIIRSKIFFFGRSIDPAHAYMEQLVYMIESAKVNNQLLIIGGLTANRKVLAGRTLESVNRESQQILGGLRYSGSGKGARIEQIGRDVRVLVVGGGSEEILADLAVKEEIKAQASRRAKL
jgi:alkylation response protein AidB-like acyl-CoA dehydrogenase